MPSSPMPWPHFSTRVADVVGVSSHQICHGSCQKRLDRVALRGRILFADLDQPLQIVRLEKDEADDVRTGRLPGAESAREIPKEAWKTWLELSSELAKIARRPQHEDVDDAHLLALLG